MFRIRQVLNDGAPANTDAIQQVQSILRDRFPAISAEEVDELPAKLRDPLKYRFRFLLFVAEDARGRVRGFASVLHAPDLDFCYLDFIATSSRGMGGGAGGALYERVRNAVRAMGVDGLFFECLPDDPLLSPNAQTRRQNARRLKFYEQFGARPILGTAYETPLSPDDTDPPYLVYDNLGEHQLPPGARLGEIARAILERKYGERCPPEYVEKVVRSFREGAPVLRPFRYREEQPAASQPAANGKIPLVVNDRHDIHHIRERGYVEAPVRVRAILRELEKTTLFERIEPKEYPETHIRAVHEGAFVDYLRRSCATVEPNRSVYPYVFPIRNRARPPRELTLRAGYWCIDTFTPINPNAWPAARRAVDCTLTAADQLLEGHRLAYSLVRPPGHHAERRAFGGFCYFCNPAIAAHYLSRFGRVAILDIDYHHGNGQQDIFYSRADVLTVSIHGHPRFAYPYFSGFRDETGEGPGAGFNLNIPLPETITPNEYREALDEALRRIARYEPTHLVLALGLDTAVGDPTGSWPHRADDFERIGRTIGEAGYPTLVVQEGGYRTRTLGTNAAHFFTGLWNGARTAKPRRPAKGRPPRSVPSKPEPAETADISFRPEVRSEDVEAIRTLVASTGFFTAAEEAVAVELATDRVEKSGSSDYHFVVAEAATPSGESRLAGYACYGPIPGTDTSWDLYWIAVDPHLQRQRLGRRLMTEVEKAITERGGDRLYADTSSTEKYSPTRAFYRRAGFTKAAELADFYRPGDGKVIYIKRLKS